MTRSSPVVSPHVFREYDVRGIVGQDLNAEVTYLVGRAFASHARVQSRKEAPRIVVGRDNRLSSPELAGGLVSGLRDSGADVIELGEVPTPTAYWSESALGADASCQVTGSHNPREWNGVKLVLGGNSLYGSAIRELLRRINEGDFDGGSGSLDREEVLDRYIADVSGRFELARPMKVAADAGNGVGSLVAERLLTRIGAEVTPICCESDGRFPVHHPDPTVDENLTHLIEAVRGSPHDLGVAFDGDADRLGVVDEDGHIVRGDVLLLIFGLELLRMRGPGQRLVFDVKCSKALPDRFAELGGVPVMWKTGHSLIKRKMKECGARLAGELSGHFIIADGYHPFDDAPHAACHLVSIISRSPLPLADMVATFPSYVSTREVRVNVPESDKWRIVEEVGASLASRYVVNDVDGVRADISEGWALVRASNTQPQVTVRCEARSMGHLVDITGELEAALAVAGVSARLDW